MTVEKCINCKNTTFYAETSTYGRIYYYCCVCDRVHSWESIFRKILKIVGEEEGEK